MLVNHPGSVTHWPRAQPAEHQFVELLRIIFRPDCLPDFQQLPGQGKERRVGAAVFQNQGAFPVFQQARLGQPSAGLPGGAFAAVQEGDLLPQHPGDGPGREGVVGAA